MNGPKAMLFEDYKKIINTPKGETIRLSDGTLFTQEYNRKVPPVGRVTQSRKTKKQVPDVDTEFYY